MKASSGIALERRILTLLELGPRPAMFCEYMAAGRKEYQRAIGSLVLKGLIVFRGKTSGRRIAINGRRRKA